MRKARHVLAAVAILGVVPIAPTAILTAHLLLDHLHDAAGLAAGLAVTLHGHAHERNTPSHSHGFIAPKPALRVNLASAPSAAPDAHPAGMLGPVLSLQSDSGGSSVTGSGARWGPDPPPSSLLSTILRI
jgi:hypothetical protein